MVIPLKEPFRRPEAPRRNAAGRFRPPKTVAGADYKLSLSPGGTYFFVYGIHSKHNGKNSFRGEGKTRGTEPGKKRRSGGGRSTGSGSQKKGEAPLDFALVYPLQKRASIFSAESPAGQGFRPPGEGEFPVRGFESPGPPRRSSCRWHSRLVHHP